jgi:class 3 adenylate cyclase
MTIEAMHRNHAVVNLAADLLGVRSQIVALYADLRGFSNWSEAQPLDRVAQLMKVQIERVMGICNEHRHSFHKFLGDGFVLLWEPESSEQLPDALSSALEAAFQVHWSYWQLTRQLDYPAPSGYGVGIAVGEAIRIQSEAQINEVCEVDFVGYPMNCAARMQTLASGYGTVVCSSTVRMLEGDPRRFLQAKSGHCRRLIAPDPEVVERAAITKGLKPEDRLQFRYLSFVDDAGLPWHAA